MCTVLFCQIASVIKLASHPLNTLMEQAFTELFVDMCGVLPDVFPAIDVRTITR